MLVILYLMTVGYKSGWTAFRHITCPCVLLHKNMFFAIQIYTQNCIVLYCYITFAYIAITLISFKIKRQRRMQHRCAISGRIGQDGWISGWGEVYIDSRAPYKMKNTSYVGQCPQNCKLQHDWFENMNAFAFVMTL